MTMLDTKYTIDILENDIHTLMLLAKKKRRPIGVMTNKRKVEGYFIDKNSFDRMKAMIEDALDNRLVKVRLVHAKPHDFEPLDANSL
jgi:PHD/YefM family antitoxin component YafN of YafNO toxin-antitoxin module